jgi:hypothetical protein
MTWQALVTVAFVALTVLCVMLLVSERSQHNQVADLRAENLRLRTEADAQKRAAKAERAWAQAMNSTYQYQLVDAHARIALVENMNRILAGDALTKQQVAEARRTKRKAGAVGGK